MVVKSVILHRYETMTMTDSFSVGIITNLTIFQKKCKKQHAGRAFSLDSQRE